MRPALHAQRTTRPVFTATGTDGHRVDKAVGPFRTGSNGDADGGSACVADSTGIPSDATMLERTADVRGDLGINRWAGAKASGVAEATA